MKQLISMILVIILILACGQDAQNQTETKDSQTQTIAVGKGPDALFLTPDENYLYVANVEDSFIRVIAIHAQTHIA